MTQATKDEVTAAFATKKQDYLDNHPNNFYNTVDKNYTYDSLFITPRLSDFVYLENWSGKTRNLQGAFLTFTSANTNSPTTEDAFKAALGQEEYYTGTGTGYGINIGNRAGGYWSQPYKNRTAPGAQWLTDYLPGGYSLGAPGGYVGYPTQIYDDRFPTTTPNAAQGVLGFTGVNIWRLVSEEYFIAKTAN